MEAFNIYINAFKRIKDYHTPAPRKEFNFYMLFFFLFWLIIFIPLLTFNSIFIFTVGNTSGNLIVTSVAGWVFFLLHLPSLLALVKRRLIDINQEKANFLYRVFVIIQAIVIIISLIYTIEALAIQNSVIPEAGIDISKLVLYMFLSMLNIIASITIIIFYAYLMTKQKDIT